MDVPTLAQMTAEGKKPEILFWVGCAGSFDDRAKKITKSFVRLLNKANVSYGVLGVEESCTGDPAKRAGNEFLFQMQAVSNIEVLSSYNIKKIVTTCPHCFNTIKNEYPSLGGTYEVLHHTQLLDQLIKDGKIKIEEKLYKGKKITFGQMPKFKKIKMDHRFLAFKKFSIFFSKTYLCPKCRYCFGTIDFDLTPFPAATINAPVIFFSIKNLL